VEGREGSPSEISFRLRLSNKARMERLTRRALAPS